MSLSVPFKVTYNDGREVQAVAKAKDIVAFERQYDIPFSAFTAGEARLEWIYYLAWSPLHRQGREEASFDAFMDLVDEVEEVEDEAPAVVPFERAPSGEESPA